MTCAVCQRLAALFSRPKPTVELTISHYGAIIAPDGKIVYVGPLSSDATVTSIERRTDWGK